MAVVATNQEVQLRHPAKVIYRCESYIGLVKALANGRAFLVGINQWCPGMGLESLLVSADELEPASKSELVEAAQAHCRVKCGSVEGLCWACQTLIE